MNHIMTALLFVLSGFLPLTGKAQADDKAASQVRFAPHHEHEVHVGSLLGQSGAEPGRGVSMEYIGTYRINPYLGLGAGLGAHTFDQNRISSYFPLFAVVKGYLGNTGKVTPFGQAALGYGLALDRRNDETVLLDNRGGITARGALGIELDIGRELGLIFSAGYQYQRATATYNTISTWWGSSFEEEQNLKYRRIHLQLGIKF